MLPPANSAIVISKTFNVTSPVVPPPVKPVPATTDVISPCGANAAIEEAVTVLITSDEPVS